MIIINSLAPGKFEWTFRHVIFKQILVIDDWGISCEITLTCKPQDLTDDKSTLVKVMVWCRQATSHYLNQCWPISLPPYGVTRPQWVNTLRLTQNGHIANIFKYIFLIENYSIHRIKLNELSGNYKMAQWIRHLLSFILKINWMSLGML